MKRKASCSWENDHKSSKLFNITSPSSMKTHTTADDSINDNSSSICITPKLFVSSATIKIAPAVPRITEPLCSVSPNACISEPSHPNVIYPIQIKEEPKVNTPSQNEYMDSHNNSECNDQDLKFDISCEDLNPRKFVDIEKQIDEIHEKISLILSNQEKILDKLHILAMPNEEMYLHKQLLNMQEFNDLENKLEDSTFFSYVMQSLSYLKYLRVGEFMIRLAHKELWVFFSKDGRGSRRSFTATKLCTIILKILNS